MIFLLTYLIIATALTMFYYKSFLIEIIEEMKAKRGDAFNPLTTLIPLVGFFILSPLIYIYEMYWRFK